MKRESIFGLLIAVGAALLLWLLSKSGLLHESVTSSIVTSAGTIQSQDSTGLPQFDLRDSRTFNAVAYSNSVMPMCGITEGATSKPSNPSKCTCPFNYKLYHEVSTDSYVCMPTDIGMSA